jgi:hypothetical protein
MQKEEKRDQKQSTQFEAVFQAVVKCGCGKSRDGRGQAYQIELNRADAAPFVQRKLLESSGLGTPTTVSYHVYATKAYATKAPVVGMGLFEVFDDRCIQWLGPGAPREEPRAQFKATVLGTHSWSHITPKSPAPSLEYGACHLVVVMRRDSAQFPGRTLWNQFTDPTHTVYAHAVPPTGLGVFERFDDGRVRYVGPAFAERQQSEPNEMESLKKRVDALEAELRALKQTDTDKYQIEVVKLATTIAAAITECQRGLSRRGGY